MCSFLVSSGAGTPEIRLSSPRFPSSSSRSGTVALCAPKTLSRPTIVAAVNDGASALGEAALEAAGSGDAEVV